VASRRRDDDPTSASGHRYRNSDSGCRRTARPEPWRQRLQLTKAALHYHFAGKAELGQALIGRYSDRFATALEALDASALSIPARLEGYANLYLDVLQAKRMCLCGMLAAEYQTLPPKMRDAVIRFFDANEAWLQRVVEQGRQDGSLHAVGSSKEIARAIVGGLEGAMLVARPYGDVTRFQAATAHLLAGLIARPAVN
jgi:TetR/AcrR family transcriptional regulator, transcriptional repressor for nem operon